MAYFEEWTGFRLIEKILIVLIVVLILFATLPSIFRHTAKEEVNEFKKMTNQ